MYDFLYSRMSSRDFFEFIQGKMSVLRHDELKLEDECFEAVMSSNKENECFKAVMSSNKEDECFEAVMSCNNEG
jgi:hypothetical protein